MARRKAPQKLRIRMNKRERRIFSTVGTTALSLIILALCGGFALIGEGIRSGSEISAAVISSILVDLTNQNRETNNIGELKVNPTLVAIAQAKANDMAAKGYFAHNSPDGKTPWYWFQQGGYAFSYAGENLAIDFSDSGDVEQAWMNSPAHRANILNSNFTEIGIATAVGTYNGHQTTFVVQEFGTPAEVAQAPAAVTEVTKPTEPTEIAVATTKPLPTLASVPAKTTTTGVATAPTQTAVLGAAATNQPTTQPPSTGIMQQVIRTIAGSPKTALRYSYYLLGLFMLIALLYETGLEFQKHHLKRVAVAFALLIFMSGVFVAANDYLFTPPTIVDAGSASAG